MNVVLEMLEFFILKELKESMSPRSEKRVKSSIITTKIFALSRSRTLKDFGNNSMEWVKRPTTKSGYFCVCIHK